jgi:hypothetical protein
MRLVYYLLPILLLLPATPLQTQEIVPQYEPTPDTAPNEPEVKDSILEDSKEPELKPMTATVTQMVGQIADSVKKFSIPDSDQVRIYTENLQPEKEYSLHVLVENAEVEWIEVFPDQRTPGKTIPRTEDPEDPNANLFIVTGKPGQTIDIRIANGRDPPIWETHTIDGGDNGGTDPPPSDLEDKIKELLPDEPLVHTTLVNAYKASLLVVDDDDKYPDKESTVQYVGAARRIALGQINITKSWKPLLDYISSVASDTTTKAEYVQLLQQITTILESEL